MDYNISDPNILLSMINMWLRDSYCSLEDLCADKGLDMDDITSKLSAIGYHYDVAQNRFV